MLAKHPLRTPDHGGEIRLLIIGDHSVRRAALYADLHESPAVLKESSEHLQIWNFIETQRLGESLSLLESHPTKEETKFGLSSCQIF